MCFLILVDAKFCKLLRDYGLYSSILSYKSLYHSLFESHLTYCISVWGAQSYTTMHEIFTLQKKCIRMLFGKRSYTNLYCYCNYGESGVMVNCENCNEWFHDECLGLSVAEVYNFSEFYCIECLNKNCNLSIKYITAPPALSFGHEDTFCYCKETIEGALMVECGKCRNWFHEVCIKETGSEIKSILIYFCPCCLAKHSNLKIIYIDYSKEHTKPLFKSNDILTVHNLFPYHVLLEVYKILKFRTPYCIYDILCISKSNGRGLTIPIPDVSLSSQKRTFIYKSIILWNKLYKRLLTPFSIKLHISHRLKHDSRDAELTYYDFSTKVATFKSKIKDLITNVQSIGDVNWSTINNLTGS